MKRLPGFRFDAKNGLAHFEVVVPGSVLSANGMRKHARRRKTVESSDVIDATTKYHAFRRDVLETEPPTPPAPPDTLGRAKLADDEDVRRGAVRAPRNGHDCEAGSSHSFGTSSSRIKGPLVLDFVGTLRRDGYTTRAGRSGEC